ncbi:MAG: IS4 family transposase [Candidatus Acidiferrales bacterium]
MIAPWVIDELKTADLKDKRLNERFALILDALAKKPSCSIPTACGGFNEMHAAYRFFANEKVTFDIVLEPHRRSTLARVAAQRVAILAQDTTEIDLTRPEQTVTGAGPLDGGQRRGAFLHTLHAFTPDGTPLGTVDAVTWMRDDEPLAPSKERIQKRAKTPIEDKESWRWVETLNKCRDVARDLPDTQVIALADSEADIYELLVAAQAEPQNLNWIVRACHDRALASEEGEAGTADEADATDEAEAVQKLLRERVMTSPVLYTKTMPIRGRKAKVDCENRGRRQTRKSREAEVEIRAASVTLRPPWRRGVKLPLVTLNVVLVREIAPPEGEEPVEWILLTNLPIDDVEQVRLVVDYYCVRWVIEIFFRTLKSGCRIEHRRFEHMDRLLPCLAMSMIVAWRTLYVCRLGRSCPDVSCEAVFEPSEWKAVHQVVHREPPPSAPPTLSEMVRMVARLGGYVDRKRTDPPGPQTIWIGLQRTYDLALCWQLFGPEAPAEVRVGPEAPAYARDV